VTSRRLISVLVPAFNEEANVERAYQAIIKAMDDLPGFDCEIIFTDNHSTDRTFEILQGIAEKDKRVRVIRFSRNYGYQRSLLVAYQSARGDCSVQIDCDLQDPPHLIPAMVAKWEEGHQVVYGIRKSLSDGAVVAALRRIFYRLVNRLSNDDLPLNAGEFRLVDRQIIQALQKVDDTSPYLRGLISSMGFSQVGFEYDREARVAGESKFPLRSMISLAVDGILNHSLVPLRLASITGIVVSVLTLIGTIIYLLGRLLFGQDWPAGFATTTILLLMSISLNALFLGVIGEYLGRIFMQLKQQSAPIIEKELNGVSGPVEMKLLSDSQPDRLKAK
jgi:glycosyltransferase involved in cell wall biosynthesis